ncbi:MAG: hypothetical protein D6744_01935 [Planctomycetota bacterium]|nr:MAG: hypothetical protein D6744_01935 [Planctomycetota bacterium]
MDVRAGRVDPAGSAAQHVGTRRDSSIGDRRRPGRAIRRLDHVGRRAAAGMDGRARLSHAGGGEFSPMVATGANMSDVRGGRSDESCDSREAFEREYAALRTRIRRALGDVGASDNEPPAPNDELLRTVRPATDCAALFTERAEANGMRVTHADDWPATLTEALTRHSARRIALSIGDAKLRMRVATLLSDTQRTIVEHDASDGLDALYDADASVTDVEAAIAECGALVYASSADRSRGGFLVAPLHIALVRRAQIVPDLLDWVARDAATRTSNAASIALIAGPSKTADIEGVLVTGVHGPRDVLVLLIDDRD